MTRRKKTAPTQIPTRAPVLGRIYAQPGLTEAIATDSLTEQERQRALQEYVHRRRLRGSNDIGHTNPAPAEHIPVGTFQTDDPLFICNGPKEYHPSCNDVMLIHERVKKPPIIPDQAFFEARFRYGAMGHVLSAERAGSGRLELLGDRRANMMVLEALDQLFVDRPLTGFVLGQFRERYLSNECYGCFAESLNLLSLMADVPDRVRENPSIADLAGCFEVFIAILIEWDITWYGTAERVEAWIRSNFTPSVLPHLLLDLDFYRSLEAGNSSCEGPDTYPTPAFPDGSHVIYRQTECETPVDSPEKAALWQDMEVKYAGKRQFQGFGVRTSLSYLGASLGQRQKVMNASGKWVVAKQAGRAQRKAGPKQHRWFQDAAQIKRDHAAGKLPVAAIHAPATLPDFIHWSGYATDAGPVPRSRRQAADTAAVPTDGASSTKRKLRSTVETDPGHGVGEAAGAPGTTDAVPPAQTPTEPRIMRQLRSSARAEALAAAPDAARAANAQMGMPGADAAAQTEPETGRGIRQRTGRR